MAVTEDIPEKKGGKAVLISLVLLLVGLAAGFGVVSSGVLSHTSEGVSHSEEIPLPDVSYVPIPTLIASLPDGRHLRFGAQIETAPGSDEAVNFLMPRIQDMMNEYLRTVEVSDIEAPQSLMVIRAHLLRRLQVILGTDAFRDLLVTEFVVD